jgi:hypothetical protein
MAFQVYPLDGKEHGTLYLGVTTQKPAAHFCGRVLNEAIHFEQSTMVHRTSQPMSELVVHRLGEERLMMRETTPVRHRGRHGPGLLLSIWPRKHVFRQHRYASVADKDVGTGRETDIGWSAPTERALVPVGWIIRG